ncbi:LysR family transcriptional regulator [Carnimonas bestiolae]|uniref:LysR family transcriptional regulator n=1 Tax=Carnimonas bestiolae TaxID=3402172 RepID=UPI003EDC9A69
MDINQIRAFQAVAQSGSVTAAAQQLHRAPSSITTRIHQLEEEFDQQLFLRIKNRLVISSAGRRLLQYTDQLLPLFDRAQRAMKEYNRGHHLSLGALDVSLETYLPQAIGSVRERISEARIYVRQAPSEVLSDELLNGTLDAVLNDGPVDAPGIGNEYVFSEQLVLVTDKDHPKVTSSMDLEGVDIYGFQKNCSYRLRFDQWLQQGGLSSPNVIEMESYEVMLACISGGSGAAWVPAAYLDRVHHSSSVKIHDLGSIGITDLYFSWREEEHSDVLRQLIEEVQLLAGKK